MELDPNPRQALTAAAALAASALLARRKAHASPARARLAERLPYARRLYLRGQQVALRHKAASGGVPEILSWLIATLVKALAALFGRLQAGDLSADSWVQQVIHELMDYHLAAYMAGAGTSDVPPAALERVADQVGVQLGYLNNFKAEVQSAEAFQAGWQARAQSYAAAIKQPYWSGKTELLPLPAMPGQGTQCMNNCGCAWEVRPLDAAQGNYDAFWVRGKTDSCQTCLEREAQWAPVQIRGGVLL